MPNQPWKDIYTRQAIEGSLANVNRENDVQSFLGQIASYHQLQKDSINNLPARQSLLMGINGMGKRLIINNRKVRKDASANYVITTTADQAIAKANYINTLIQFYAGAGSRFYQDPKALLEYLASPSHPAGELAQLQAACRFEQLDPAHRSFEFDFKKNTDKDNYSTTFSSSSLAKANIASATNTCHCHILYKQSSHHWKRLSVGKHAPPIKIF